jgi:hypothetical protein
MARARDLPDISAPADTARLVIDPAGVGGTGSITLANLRNAGVTPYIHYIIAEDDDGVSDQSSAIQAQIDACEDAGICHAVFPPGKIWAPGLTIAHPLKLEFASGKVFEGDADEGLPGEFGTRLIAKSGDTEPMITILTGANGATLVNPNFEQEHAVDAPGWTPTVYPPCILNLSAGTRIINPHFWGCYDGIQFGQITPSVVGSGQCSVIGMRAACFRYGINVVMAGDWVTANDYEFQAYMLGNLTNQLAYMQANAIAFHSERNDGGAITDLKTYGAKGAVLCESNAQGVTNVLKVSGAYIDKGIFAIWNKTATTIVQATNVNFAGHGGAGSFGIESDAGAFVSVEGFQASFCGTSAAITTGTGQIAITDAFINRANNDNVGAACFTAAATGKITVTGRFHRTFGANPMVSFLGAGTFVQTAVTSTGTGDYQMILKNSENLTADRTLTFQLNDAARSINLGGGIIIGSNFETFGSGGLTLTTGGATNATLPLGTHTLASLDATETFTGVKTFGSAGAVGRLKIAGTTSGAITLDATAAAGSGTLTLPAATDTLVGKATTDIFTNKTFDTAGSGNVFKIAGTTISNISGSGSTALLSTSPQIAGALRLEGSSSQVALLQATAVAGNVTLTLPAVTATVAVTKDLGVLRITLSAVNFNSANTDNAVTIPLPSGITRYAITRVMLSNASASISTATVGVFTSTGGGGQTIAANQAITVTATAADTNNNAMQLALTNANTMAYNDATLQVRVGTAQGSAATADVVIYIYPLT